MAKSASLAVASDEVRALRAIATLHLDADGHPVEKPIKLSCSALADHLGSSSQTASRRLQRLEEIGLITRETVGDGQWVTITEDGMHTMRDEYETYRQIFEGAPMVELVGHVTGGMGEGRHYISLDGYMQQFRERLGYEPFPGTLNLELTDHSVRRRPGLTRATSIRIDGWSDDDRTYGPATCYPAVVEGDRGSTVEDAHVIEPERTHHDETNLEVIAPIKLRDTLGLDDGDRLTIKTGDLA